MRNRNGLFWGIALVTLGVLFLTRNLGWLNIEWSYVRDLWPLLMILAGVQLILVRRESQAALLTTILLALAVPIVLFSFTNRRYENNRFEHRFRDNFRRDFDEDQDNDGNDEADNDESDNDNADSDDADNSTSVETRSDTFVEGISPNTTAATLNLSGGAARFVIGESAAASDLIKADTKMTQGSYSMSIERNETTGTPVIDLKPTEGNIKLRDGNLDNRVDVRLNEKPVWTINVGMGAGQGDIDLSKLDVQKLEVKVGAADLDLKLGNRASQSAVNISSGVASITVRIPNEVGCRISKEGALNLSQIDGFTKINEDLYESPNYATATKKITLNYEGGMSKFKVVRY